MNTRSKSAKSAKSAKVAPRRGRVGMKPFTVLVLRPDYYANPYGQDSYLAHVMAANVAVAQNTAQHEACDLDNDPGEGNHNDYFVMAVFEGHHLDLKID